MEQPGVLSQAATANPLMMAKALRQSQENPRPNFSRLLNYPQTWGEFGQNVAQAFPISSPEAVRGAAFQAALSAGPLATVWHGSPHRFAPTKNNPLGEFDAAKIGTGEGAQAYGHGHYLADAQKVAQDYAVTLSAKNGNVGGTIDGRPIYEAYKALESKANRLTPAQAAAEYNKLDLLERLGMNELPQDVLRYAKESYGATSPEVSWLTKEVIPKYRGAGSLYKVDLPDDQIAKMLDWDKPLSQQPESVRKALQKHLPDEFEFSNFITGKDLYSKLTNKEGWSPADPNSVGRAMAPVSQRLREMGIPGIRYLDGGSRGAGKGTSNYVVFPGNEGMLKILARE